MGPLDAAGSERSPAGPRDHVVLTTGTRHTVEVTPLPPSARGLAAAERELTELARACSDASTDAGPDEDGVPTPKGAHSTAVTDLLRLLFVAPGS